MSARFEPGEVVDIVIKGARVFDRPDPEDEPGEGLTTFELNDRDRRELLSLNLSYPQITVKPRPPVAVYFVHDRLTPHSVRATREMRKVPAVGDVLELDGAGCMGAKATWRVERVEAYETGNATCYMTDAYPEAGTQCASTLDATADHTHRCALYVDAGPHTDTNHLCECGKQWGGA